MNGYEHLIEEQVHEKIQKYLIYNEDDRTYTLSQRNLSKVYQEVTGIYKPYDSSIYLKFPDLESTKMSYDQIEWGLEIGDY